MTFTRMGWHNLARGIYRPAWASVLAICGGSLLAKPALADCAAPEPGLVWSFPAQGDTGVPTNADLWLMDSGWGSPPRVTLEGVPLTPLALPFGYDLGELEPNTTYTLSVEPDPDYDPSTASPAIDVSFTTGAGPGSSDPAAAPMAVTTSRTQGDSLSPLCGALLDTQDCFDTGQNSYFHFAPSGDARAWLISSSSIFRRATLWPTECGDPRMFLHASAAPCATLYGIDAVGATHAGEEVCATAVSPDKQEPPLGGTATASVSSPPDPPASNAAAALPVAEHATLPSTRQTTACALSPSPATASIPSLGLLGLLALIGLARSRKRR